MRISLKREYLWSDFQQRYILTRDLSIIRTTPILWCKGASAQQSSLADAQQNFYTTLTNDYNTQFANQSAILGTLNQSLSPIIAAGPNQFGFSAAQTANLNAQAIQGTGQQYANASKALGAQQAAQGGGNAFLPTGAQAAQQGALASSAANQASNQLLGIQQAGYQQGNNMYNNAVAQLGGVAGMYNPTGYAGASTGAGAATGTTLNDITQANNSVFNAWMGLAGAGLGALGSVFKGAGSGNNNNNNNS